MYRQGIIIDTNRTLSSGSPGVPQVLSNSDRYAHFVERLAQHKGAPGGNNHPWEWKTRRKKTFLEMKPKNRKQVYRKMSQVATEVVDGH